jgi:hypothetical protein
VNDLLFSDYGIEVLKRDGRFFIRYDAGEVAIQMREDEISGEEFLKGCSRVKRTRMQYSYPFNEDR